jgi:acylphosphatase
MKLHKYLIKICSTNTYEREIIAENEDKAINKFIETISDNDKISEEQFDVQDIENLGIAEQEDF